MKTSGYNVWLHKYIAFIICGLFSGLAGVLNAFHNGFVSPGDLSIRTSFDAMLMVIVGGVGTLIGPVIGAAAIVGLRNYLSIYMARWMTVLGIVFMISVLYAPNGILGWLRARRRVVPLPEPEKEMEKEKFEWFPSRIIDPVKGREGKGAVEKRDLGENPTLRLENVNKSFGALLALNGVSMKVYSGDRTAIIGPNGAGKTTLFHLISGVQIPSSGRIFLFDKDITRIASHRRIKMGLARTYQVTNLYLTLTSLDNIRLGIMGTRKEKYVLHRAVSTLSWVDKRAKELLDYIDLWDKRNVEVRHLSYGHQRQLEVIMALASNPKVLLLDEPTAGLSHAEIGPVVNLIKSLDPKLTLLIIEHDMDVAFQIADDIMVFHYGQMLTKGTKEQIQADATVREIYLGRMYRERNLHAAS